MSRLTVTEKEHWKQRIERRIDKAIEATERRHPNLMNDIKTKADALALDSMGIASQMQEVKSRREQSEALIKEAEGSCPFCARSVKRSLDFIFSEFGSDWLARVTRRPAESVGPECLLRFGVSPLRLAFGSSFCRESSTAVLRQ